MTRITKFLFLGTAFLFGGIIVLTQQALADGGVPLWTNRYNGPGNANDQAYAIAVDKSGNVFVAGFRTNGTGSGYHRLTVKYSATGVSLWTNRYEGSEDFFFSQGVAMAVDSSGNVFVTGSSIRPASGYDYATVAYSGAGVPLWTNRYNGPQNDQDIPFGLVVDSNGNVYVTGRSIGSNGNYDYATIKYSSSISAPPRLDFRRLNNQLVLSWTNASFNLQSVPTVNGTFTNIPGARSPHTNSLTSSQQYFRLKTD